MIVDKARVSVKQQQLAIFQEGEEVLVSPENLDFCLIESPFVQITTSALCLLTENKVATLFCNEKRLPHSFLMGYHQHSRHTEVLRLQLDQSVPFKKRLWQRVIQSKIRNQSAVLTSLGIKNNLLACALKVKSGDPDNLEARAARSYWSSLFRDFVRDRDNGDARNAHLNYGYSILRSCVARSLVAFGLTPSFGIHHSSGLNAFNLVDDFLEPFRPFVDLLVARQGLGANSELTHSHKKEFILLTSASCLLGNKQYELRRAITKLVENYISCLNSSLLVDDISFPCFRSESC